MIGASSPRSIGRAGTTLVGDDGAGALVANPSAMARRESMHAQIGIAFVDDEMSWQSPDRTAPIVRNQAASTIAPYGAAFAAYRGWVFGIGAMTAVNAERTFRPPRDLPPGEFGNAFDYRYLGIAGSLRQNTATIGVARRIGDSFAIGVSLSGSRVELTETRRLWAGFDGRDKVGSPEHDLELAFSGVDSFVPGAVVGALFAPSGTPFEMAVSAAWSAAANLDARVFALGTRPFGPSILGDQPIASMELDQPVIMRGGARYVSNRIVCEIGGDIARASPRAKQRSWQIVGLTIADGPSGAMAELTTVPSRASTRTHGAIRGAVDFEVLPGFLWATAGYGFAVGSVGSTKQSTSFGDLGGHTLGLGIEASAGGFTFTLGWARTWAVGRTEQSDYRLDNPFRAGDAPVLSGLFDGSIDQVGIFVDADINPN